MQLRNQDKCLKGLDKQGTTREEAVWSGSFLFAILTSILWIPALKTNYLFENRRRKLFQILDCQILPIN